MALAVIPQENWRKVTKPSDAAVEGSQAGLFPGEMLLCTALQIKWAWTH